MSGDPRLAELRDWIASLPQTRDAGIEPASADASFRRYFRAHLPSASYIVMDAPPAQEDSMPFVRVAGFLETMGINAPRIIEADLERGFLLLTDLGSTHYLERLSADRDAAGGLYRDAIEALVRMQANGAAYQAKLPPYDEALLRFELSLFHDWLCEKHLGIEFDAKRERAWQTLCDRLVANALDQPQVFVHRDYHSRNLMVTPADNPGVIDFQDAVEGPITYDLVSLLRDCYISWPAERLASWIELYLELRTEQGQAPLDAGDFLQWFDLMGVQRQLKAAGIFARLNHRDGKPVYIHDIPRTLGYVVEVGERYAELAWLIELVTQEVLPGLEAQR